MRVACVMVTNRPAFVLRAVRMFEAQTYADRHLIIVNTGGPLPPELLDRHAMATLAPGPTVGMLRNIGAELASTMEPDLIVHWDDDDFSHPERLAWQVGMHASADADVTGFSDLRFWDSWNDLAYEYRRGRETFAVGASLCYTPAAWRRHPFPDQQRASDTAFVALHRVAGTSSIVDGVPMLVAELHSSNMSSRESIERGLKGKAPSLVSQIPLSDVAWAREYGLKFYLEAANR